MKNLLSGIKFIWVCFISVGGQTFSSTHLKRALFILPVFLALAALMGVRGLQGGTTQPVSARPLATCPPTGCPEERVFGYQPPRYDMRPTFVDAASNSLGSDGPAYLLINHGLPPAMIQIDISAGQPIPHQVMRAMAWGESHWLQFGDSVVDPDDVEACTLLSPDCGYGVMQITSCMTGNCGWLDPGRVSGELAYNIGAGANFLVIKWNSVPFVGQNDHTFTEEWYYAVLAYNGWSYCNDPNRDYPAAGCPASSPFDPARPPWGEINYGAYKYPYQEKIWGYMGHPERTYLDPHLPWRPSRVAAIPRGIFGLGSGWTPPSMTPRPTVHLFPAIQVADEDGPTLRLENTTAETLAVDISLYNDDGSFNRRWLGAPDPPYPYPYIRLAASEVFTAPLAEAFRPGQSFSGIARLDASEGVSIMLSDPDPYLLYLPLAYQRGAGNCTNVILNGGFEELANGRPSSWKVSSADGYALADGTWFTSGHRGAYLGGYDNASDVLRQTIDLPAGATAIRLVYNWYVRTAESPAEQHDWLRVRLRETNGDLVKNLEKLSNECVTDSWQTAAISLLEYAGQAYRLSFEAKTDEATPTSFFLDDVGLWVCGP